MTIDHHDEPPAPTPTSVPPDLTQPSARFRLHAWLCTAALVAFVAVYLGLLVWLGALLVRFARLLLLNPDFFVGLRCVVPALLFFVLIRGLFAIKRGTDLEMLVDVTAAQEPSLVAFIHEVADRAGAPRPHRIVLAPEVNAAVFYDLGFVNFLVPTKKNLLIGLGLLNVLTRSELRAVLAHEFGHFAQRSMTVGRWVYLAEQIASYIVMSRSRVDRWLGALSVQDVRIAWAGWLLRLCVWTVRAVLDTMLLLVTLSKRALSREMELQADRVAASVTGSDALVHALRKAHAAEQGLGAALGTLQRQLVLSRRCPDVYALQTRHIDNVRRVGSDPLFGLVPPLPSENPEGHRVFEKGLAQPSKMWSTHPPDREREDHIKRVYVPCALDDRPAWTLFVDPARTRREITDRLVSAMLAASAARPVVAGTLSPPTSELAPAQVDAVIDAQYARPFHRAEYRGAFLGRALTLHSQSPDALFDAEAAAPWTAEQVPAVEELYPEAMRGELAHWRQLSQDLVQLEGLRDGHLRASDAKMSYRGEPVLRSRLPALIARVRAERDAAAALVARRDRAARTVHQRIARAIGHGWAEYHASLVQLLHYAEHTGADLADAHGHWENVLQIIMADGHVSRREVRRLLVASKTAHGALLLAHGVRHEVVVPDGVLERFNRSMSPVASEQVRSFSERLGALGLGEPAEHNIGEWVSNAPSWLATVPVDFEHLGNAALDEILEVEATLRGALAAGPIGVTALGQAPEPARSPGLYARLVPGNERPRQRTLDAWDRFQLADGIIPGLARAAVSGALLWGMILLGRDVRDRDVYVFNGTGTAVRVVIGQTMASVGPGQYGVVRLPSERSVHVRSTGADGQNIEEFDADVSDLRRSYVYNVARAAMLYQGDPPVRDLGAQESTSAFVQRRRLLGNPRWTLDVSLGHFGTPASNLSEVDPSFSLDDMLCGTDADVDPPVLLSAARDGDERAALARAHLRLDPPSPVLARWVRLTGGSVQDLVRLRGLDGQAAASFAVALFSLAWFEDRGEHRSATCERFRSWAADRSDAAGVFVRASCLNDPRAYEQSVRAAYAQLERDPSRPYLALALAEIDEARGAFEDVVIHCSEALESPVLADRAGLLAARMVRGAWALGRITHGGGEAGDILELPLPSALTARSPSLRAQLAREQTVLPPNPIHALARGDLEGARRAAAGDGTQAGLLALIAASDGADPSEARAALATPAALDPQVSLSLLALAVREGQSPAEGTRSAARAVLPDLDRALSWLATLRASEQPTREPPRARGRRARPAPEGSQAVELTIPEGLHHPTAMLMATIALGARAPLLWRATAQGYFFASERPYLSLSLPR